MQREETGKLTIESVRSFIYSEPTKVQRLKWIAQNARQFLAGTVNGPFAEYIYQHVIVPTLGAKGEVRLLKGSLNSFNKLLTLQPCRWFIAHRFRRLNKHHGFFMEFVAASVYAEVDATVRTHSGYLMLKKDIEHMSRFVHHKGRLRFEFANVDRFVGNDYLRMVSRVSYILRTIKQEWNVFDCAPIELSPGLLLDLMPPEERRIHMANELYKWINGGDGGDRPDWIDASWVDDV